jgi:hypothetical protein
MFPSMSQHELVEDESQGSETFSNTRNKSQCSNHDLFSRRIKVSNQPRVHANNQV